MKNVTTRTEAEQAIKAAGYKVGRQVWFEENGFGYVFSFEGDRRCYGHPMMEVRYTQKEAK